MIHNIPSGNLRPLVGENNPSRSNPRAAFSQLNHQLPSIQCNQLPASNVQLPQIISSTNTSNAGRSLYEPTHAAASVAAPAHFPVTRETATQKSQALPEKTLGLDGHGQGSSKCTMQRRP
ncbi:hypothetical protein GUJ93_ZPchr0001g29816 [Zizania palustris]|uniref:Uncharacterized protein n=1 Tax=Zizania palustris TaxID=103762 RepID=A0A8J5RNJ7_ZIZPA|nr:hypothetical protein GUJ93_ZPchr0001g29816 [Zizania palustris]